MKQKLPSGFIVTSFGQPCLLDGTNFDPPVLVPVKTNMRDFPPRVFGRTRAANTAIYHTCSTQRMLKGSLVEELPAVQRLLKVGSFQIVSLREQAKQEQSCKTTTS